MSLALFDLDHTLIDGDSDFLWGQFLCEQQIVDTDYYERENQLFYDDYRAGELDIQAFLAFALKPLAENPMDDLLRWRASFIEQKIKPKLYSEAFKLVDKHRRNGDTLVIVTATNRFVTEPIAGLFGVENLIATEPEIVNARYTGGVTGTPCFAEGKVIRLASWLKGRKLDLDNSYFYSDSHNDLPLLKQVSNPVAVNPDDELRKIAAAADWPMLEFKS